MASPRSTRSTAGIMRIGDFGAFATYRVDTACRSGPLPVGFAEPKTTCPVPAGPFRVDAGPRFASAAFFGSAPSARQYREAPDWQGQSVFGCPVQWP
jgi:hypothetical protein